MTEAERRVLGLLVDCVVLLIHDPEDGATGPLPKRLVTDVFEAANDAGLIEPAEVARRRGGLR